MCTVPLARVDQPSPSFSSVTQEPLQPLTQTPLAETLQTYLFNKYTTGVSIRLLFPLPLSHPSLHPSPFHRQPHQLPTGPTQDPKCKKGTRRIRGCWHSHSQRKPLPFNSPAPGRVGTSLLALVLSDAPLSLDEARIRNKVPINAAPRRQMRALVSSCVIYTPQTPPQNSTAKFSPSCLNEKILISKG